MKDSAILYTVRPTLSPEESTTTQALESQGKKGDGERYANYSMDFTPK